MTAGASWNKQRTHYFKVVDDLLGGDFWVDLNQFAELDVNDPVSANNDLEHPNHVVREGDVFGYDHEIHTRLINAFGQVEKKWNKVEAYAGATVSQTSYWRVGNMRNGLFPETSKGTSDKQNFLNAGVKAGAVYKLSGRHYFTANASFLTRPPAPRTAYLSPRMRPRVIDGLVNEKVLGFDISYLARMPRLKGRATLYYTRINDQVWNRTFFNDDLLANVNYSMTGVDQTHMGLDGPPPPWPRWADTRTAAAPAPPSRATIWIPPWSLAAPSTGRITAWAVCHKRRTASAPDTTPRNSGAWAPTSTGSGISTWTPTRTAAPPRPSKG